jgi:hypothetical protein
MTDAFVAFIGRQRREFWTDLLNPKGFRHCHPFWYDPMAERWIIMDGTQGNITVDALTPAQFDHWLDVMQRAGAVFLGVRKKISPIFLTRLGLWCVPLTAHAIGSRSRAFRPIGLFRDLMRDGAVRAFVRPSMESADNDESQDC